MRAVVLYQTGDPEVLQYREDIPEPQLQPDEVLVRVRATSLNRVDIVIRRGYPGLELRLPHILGGDIAGEIVECGSAVEHLRPGQRVLVYPIVWCGRCSLCRRGLENLCVNWQYFGMHRAGSYAEYVAVPARCCIELPENVDFAEAACLPIAGLTAFHALVSVAQLQPGETLLLWGASGGMGNFAIQLAKLQGAQVIATTRRYPQLEATLSEWGADLVLPHDLDVVSAKLRELLPDGVDVVLDYVGPSTFPSSFALLRKGGRVVLCGILTGRESMLSLHQTYLRHLTIYGIYLGTLTELKQLLELLAMGQLRPAIAERLPLSEAVHAHRLMESSQHVGKLILLP